MGSVRMQIFLIRHGETDSNAARVVQLPGAALSQRGLAQAERLADRLAHAGVAHILSSDLHRAAMTAERIAARTGAAVEVVGDLQERNFGELRGVAYADLGLDPFAADYVPPGGESWEEFHARVERAWASVRTAVARREGNLAVVTHGLVCHSLALRHLRLPAGIDVPRSWRNASLTVVEPSPPWRVTLLDCTSHLDTDTGADRATV
jgi:broad specificity phosphatase PhoE